MMDQTDSPQQQPESESPSQDDSVQPASSPEVPPVSPPPTPPPADADMEKEVQEMMDDLSDQGLEALYDVGVGPQASAPEDGIHRCPVVKIAGDDVFIDVGGKSQGVVPLSQFEGKTPEVGNVVEVVFDYYDSSAGLMVMSLEGATKRATWNSLDRGVIVNARVTGMNKGGLELNINGIRAFMPASQVDVEHVHDISVFIGQKVQCVVMEVDRRDENVLISRRKYLQQQQAVARETLFSEIQEGQTREGVVARVVDFGAFVDMGGADGLLHVKDMSYSRVEKASDIVKEGDKVEVKVLSVDRDKERISLGLKQVQPDPWNDIEQKYPQGVKVSGRVTRLAKFGAFVEIEPGVEALLPIGEMSWRKRLKHPSDLVAQGDVVACQVLKCDGAARRISLGLKQLEEDPWLGVADEFPEGNVVAGRVTKLADFGAFVQLRPAVEGLVHISEIADQRIRQAGDVLQVDQEVQVRVLNVDMDSRRISLSIRRAAEGAELTDDQADAAAKEPSKKKKRKKPLRGGVTWDWDIPPGLLSDTGKSE